MKRICVLMLFMAGVLNLRAQSHDGLIEAYRRGALTSTQIESLKQQYGITNISTPAIMQQMKSGSRSRGNSGGESGSQQQGIMPMVEMPPQYQGVDTSQHVGFPADTLTTIGNRSNIFGHNIFQYGGANFEPNLNVATPGNYILGTGDEIIIDLWGDSQSTLREELSPEGSVVIPDVGPVVLAGLTIQQAERRLRNAMSAIYEGLKTGSVNMMLSLGRIRSIKVNVVGEVITPGSYTLPSLATLVHALHAAGGVDDIGSLRRVHIYRNGKEVAELDLYKYILSGDDEQDMPLCDGDLIVVSPYESMVTIAGEVRRPMKYEMLVGESLADAITYAGGFSGGANRQTISVVRRQGGRHKSYTIASNAFHDFQLMDGDSIAIGGGINRYENRVEVRGAVMREGFYAIDDDMTTLCQLLHRAEGVREDAFMQRAILYREKDDFTPQLLAIDLQGVISGVVEDVELRPNDLLVISSIDDMREEYTVGIYGAVNHSGDYPYAENMTVEDLIFAAKGLRESASTANITIVRRIKNPRSLSVQDLLFEIFVVDVNNGLSVKDGEFELQPFDQVFVRRSPVYITQSSVTVEGEVAFSGFYPLSRRNMRLSEIIAEAGFPTPGAFVEGAYLLRKMTSEERVQNDALQKLIEKQRGFSIDSLGVKGVNLSSVYPVGINLAEALANPGTDADVVLQDGDVISIPKYNGTVRVMGSVLYPNSVTYKDGRRLKYYIDSAGGFDNRARKNRSFVIYMNGMVSSGLSSKIRPGCVIVVPSKLPVPPLRWTDILGLISSSASTAAVVMSAINIAK